MTFLSACRLVCVSDVTCGQRSRPVQSVWQSVGQRDREGEREREKERAAPAQRGTETKQRAQRLRYLGGKLKQLAFLKKKNSQKTTKPKNKQNRDIAVGKFDRSFAFFPCTDIKWKGYLAACWILNLTLHRCGVDFRVAQAESVWVVCWRNFRHSGSNLSWTSRNQSGSKLNHLPTALTACRTL